MSILTFFISNSVQYYLIFLEMTFFLNQTAKICKKTLYYVNLGVSGRGLGVDGQFGFIHHRL